MTFYVLKKRQCSVDAERLFDVSIHQLIQTEEFANIIAGRIMYAYDRCMFGPAISFNPK
jgi:hypothetical protein